METSRERFEKATLRHNKDLKLTMMATRYTNNTIEQAWWGWQQCEKQYKNIGYMSKDAVTDIQDRPDDGICIVKTANEFHDTPIFAFEEP